jgi:rubrerythrin
MPLKGDLPLAGSQTEANLQLAFARDSQANRRYLYFAQKADIEGYPDSAGLFKNVSDSETGHAHGHLEYLASMGSGDPVTGLAIGDTADNLKSAIEGETQEYTELYPGFAQAARDEGFVEIAEWFETLARSKKAHADRFELGLNAISGTRNGPNV